MNTKNYKKNIAGQLAQTFIDHPLTLMLGIFILVMGYITLQISPREANPQIVVAGGAVIVPYPGVKASEIQKVIVEPLQRRLREVEGVENIFGIAQDNFAILNVQFYLGEERDKANFRLYNSVLRNVDALPKGIMQPIVKTMDIDTDISIASIAFYPKDSSVSMTDVYKTVTDIQTKVNRLDNVAITDLIGERKEQYNIEVDLQRLTGFHISLGQVVKSIEGLMVRTPDITGRTKDNKLIVFGVDKAIRNVKDIQNIQIVSYGGSPIYLKDIATVTKGEDIQNMKSATLTIKESGLANEIPQTTLSISKKKGANVVDVNRDIFDLLELLKPKLDKEKIGYIITRDDGYTANHSVNELVTHIVISVIIIGILLILTLGYKEAFIVTLTVPMIISLTLFAGYMLDQSINKISLFALLLSLGLLVDSAIIVIENIHRHFHDHDAGSKTVKEIAIAATNEVGNPTNLATIAIIMTFLTMFLVGGTIGQYIRPIAIFAPIAMFASLIVAYIFTPYFVNKIMTKED
ncbi:MAG: efflux RND transporter permease subunit [Campylobacterota bacterium]|nr:efflux RND transporter permease subunit [Campylobacterota bacterium]